MNVTISEDVSIEADVAKNLGLQGLALYIGNYLGTNLAGLPISHPHHDCLALYLLALA